MKIVNKKFYASRVTRKDQVEQNLGKQIRDYKKVLRDLHPRSKQVTYMIRDRGVRTWSVEFHVR